MTGLFSNPPLGLSRKATDSFKAALAITIAYGIALHMDWEQPRWAAITIALVSLSTIGQSLNNAVERIFGTITAGLVALILLGFFGQDRWSYILVLSLWMGLCTYLMGGKKLENYWMMSGFASAIIAVDAGLNAARSFEFVMLRLEQTMLGLITYTLVFILLWPTDGYASFKAVSGKLSGVHQKLYRLYLELMNGRLASADKAQTTQQLRVQAIQLQNQFVMLLEGVEKERYEVWEVRDKWERFKEQVVELNETLGYWRESFSEVQALDLSALVPGLDVLTQEIDQRLTQLNRMLADDAPTQAAQPIELAPNPSALQALSAFQKAAFTVYFKHLRSLDTLTRTMFDTLGDIKGFAPESSPVAESQSTPFFALLDIDRLLGALRVVLTLWLSYALLIWFNPIPGGGNLVAMAAASGMAVALAPQLPIKMFMPALTAFILFTAVIYFFLLPQLTTFAELGLVIFVVSFLVFYCYFEPQQMLFKGLGIVLFLTLINVHNEQSYDFKYFADTSVMFYIIALVLQITAFIPFSPKPEHAYLRLVRRFFRCAEYLVSTLPKDPQEQLGPWENWKKAFCWREIAVVPNKLALWGQFINRQTRSGTSPEQIQALTINLHALTYRLQELLNARADVHADRLVQEAQSQALRTSIRPWQTRMQETFQCLSADPTAGNSKTFRAELDEIVKNLETRIEETLNTSSKVQLDPEDRENVYRLLGAYRSVSEAMGDYVASTDAIHWSRWQEEKF